jgi:hypothetical protein
MSLVFPTRWAFVAVRLGACGLALLAAIEGGCSDTARSGINGSAGEGGGAAGEGAGGAGGGTGVSPISNDRSCAADSDCVQCLYIAAPTDASQCPTAQGCCGGQTMNQAACDVNRMAWEANCSDQSYPIPLCPCVAREGSSTVTCKVSLPVNSASPGECGFW